MSLEDVIEKFCSPELMIREHNENKSNLDNTERSQCSHSSQKVEPEELLYDFEACNLDSDIFSNFFNKGQLIGLKLLADDKDWLQSIGYGRVDEELLEQYIKIWLDAMNKEQDNNRKQNSGRFAANTFIREILENGY